MLHATIDPGNLVLPQATTATIFEDHLDLLLDVSSAVKGDWLTMHSSAGLMDALAQDNLLPLRGVINQLLSQHGIDEISSHDVEQLLFGILERIKFLEDDLAVEVILCDQVSVQPSSFLNSPTPSLRRVQQETLELLALGIKAGVGHRMTPYLSVQCQQGTVAVAGRLDAFAGADCCSLVVGVFSANIAAVGDFESLLLSAPASTLICGPAALNEVKVRAAIHMAILQLCQQSQSISFDEIPDFAIGSEFVESLSAIGATRSTALADRILMAAAEVVCQQNLRKSHAIRVNAGGGSPALKQGSLAAQRHDVDYEVHLHYWRGSGRTVELASVVMHNEFRIPSASTGL